MVHKLYIDSRQRVSGTASSFTIQLARPIELPDSRAFIDAVSIANAFPSIHAASRAVYVREELAISGGSPLVTNRRVLLDVGFYHGFTLAEALALALNTGTSMSAIYTVTFLEKLGKFRITNAAATTSSKFQIWPKSQLLTSEWNEGNIHSAYQGDDASHALGIAGDAISKETT